MTGDLNRGIAWIKYNCLHLPYKIQFSNGNKSSYAYDATGMKRSVQHAFSLSGIQIPFGADTIENTQSIQSLSQTDYCGNFIYEDGQLSRILTPEGYIETTDSTGSTANTGNWRFSYFLKDHLGNVRARIACPDFSSPVPSSAPSSPPTSPAYTLLDTTDYYPFGMEISSPEGLLTSGNNPYLYNGKELDRMHGLNMYDYGWRFYDPQLGRFHTQDRYTENFSSWSPYHYANNNPILNVDIMGDSTVVSGAESAAAVQQLQDATSTELTITQNASGTINATHTGIGPISPDAQQVLDAANSSTITVNVVAENTKTTSTGNLYIGGAFMGNTVTQTANGNIVVANQEVNPQVLGPMSNANGKPGADMMHEVTEAYQGAVTSQISGVSSPMAGQAGSVYNQAHSAATPQSGAVYETVYDARNNVINTYNGAVRVEYSVRPVGGGAPVIIMNFP